MNEAEKNALRFIHNKEHGYFSALIDKIGPAFVADFKSVGFIICGFSRKGKTWRCSNLGHQYVKDLDLA